MSIETDVDTSKYDYADEETHKQVKKYLNSGDIYKKKGEKLRSQAGLILEKVVENYLEPESAQDMTMHPKADHFTDQNTAADKVGQALSVLAEDDAPTDFDTWRDTPNTNTYDMTDVDYKEFCAKLEVIAKIEDDVLEMETDPQNGENERQDAFLERLGIY